MDRFYNIPYLPNSKPNMYPKLPRDPNAFPAVAPGSIPITEYKKSKNRLGFPHNSAEQKDHATPSNKVVIRGWRSWNMSFKNSRSELSITSPARGLAAVLEADECRATAHCDPSCKAPCRYCECGIYLRYQPPNFDEVHAMVLIGNGYASQNYEEGVNLQIWFSCEAIGKVVYGDLGSRSEKVRPLFGIIPPVNEDSLRRLKIYLPAYFGPQLQLLQLRQEEIENLRWGEVWEE